MLKSGPETAAITARYRAFAAEARGRSPRYEELAMAVGRDQPVLAFLATLPPAKRQPNLLFAAARYLLGAPPVIGSLGDLVRRYGAELTQVIMTRRTQTNEPARCAVLLPVLAGLPQPFTAADARQALQTTRRVAIPLLEFLDRAGVTERLPDDRRRLLRPPTE